MSIWFIDIVLTEAAEETVSALTANEVDSAVTTSPVNTKLDTVPRATFLSWSEYMMNLSNWGEKSEFRT